VTALDTDCASNFKTIFEKSNNLKTVNETQVNKKIFLPSSCTFYKGKVHPKTGHEGPDGE
jgi:hypothetical protein